jgi:hypothetical protein
MVEDNAQRFDWDKEVRAAEAKLTPKKLSKKDVLAKMSDAELDEIIKRIGKKYVVMNKSGTSILQNPGTGLPFFTPIKQRAEQIASESGGVAITFDEAFKILTKANK